TVTITATDSDGATSTTTFALVVNNVAPTVSATQATVAVPEGSVATNSGLWADVGLDGVTLSASVGVITQHGDGTWQQLFATQDGPDQTQTVTITATDSDGATSTATFALVVNNVAPTVSAAQATVAVSEGSVASNSGLWSDVGLDSVTLSASTGVITQHDDG